MEITMIVIINSKRVNPLFFLVIILDYIDIDKKSIN
jgi:hypothetical protein